MAQELSVTAKTVWDSVKLYTVQCSECSKWRLIPTKEKYEKIRERIFEESFQCQKVREWRENISCDDDSDVNQDGSLCWAIDKPSIPQTPPGWQRIMRLRAEGGTKFADIYLSQHPKYQQEGVSISRFSFQSPVPLDADYVAKRRAVSASSKDMTVNPIPNISPSVNVNSHCDGPNKAIPEIDLHCDGHLIPLGDMFSLDPSRDDLFDPTWDCTLDPFLG
ncbi:hypothetical protein DH2020_030654 [Rehmannia glutinosa]|uniref:CW-type domain-containing protein n=1 Tax=Rehmannia glutinosa TaxID=99300 RepID=A0ABR0VKF3_REHGL